MSDRYSATAEWLQKHGLTKGELEDWHVRVTPDRLRIPVYSAGGRLMYNIDRRYDHAPYYALDPHDARPRLALYGINRALPAIRKLGEAVVVEGFSDVIAMHKAGVANCVGALGSSWPKVRRALLRVYADSGLVLGDGDEAGKSMASAAWRVGPGWIGATVEGLDPGTYALNGLDPKRVVRRAWVTCDVYKLRYVELDRELKVVGGIAVDNDHALDF